MKLSKLILLFVLDFLCVCICLCVFAYFHHVRMLWSNDKSSGVFGVDNIDVQMSDELSDASDEQSDVSNNDITAPQMDTCDITGQFGQKFAHLFAKNKDEYIYTANEYKSHDVYIKMTEKNAYVNDGNAHYFVYDIYVRNITNLYTLVNMKSRIEFSEFISAAEIKPSCVVSGDFCGNANAALEVVRNGTELRSSDRIKLDLCVLGYDGNITTFTPKTYSHDAVIQLDPYQVWNFGPVLVKNGERLNDYSARTDIGGCNPRTAIGEVEPGHYVFICVDGRCRTSNGCKLRALSHLIYDEGVVEAYNLDGGASTFAYFNDAYQRYGDAGCNPRYLYDVVCIGDIR